MLAQREKGRRGSMVGVDQALADKEKRASQRNIGEQTRRRKMEDRQQASCSTTTKSVITQELAMTLDRTNVSDRQA